MRLSLLSASLVALVLCSVFPASIEAQQSGPFSKAPTVSRLPNGLTLVSIPWHSPGIVAYYTLVRVGARDEVEPGHSGFAHLFEHMMFRGTERFSESAYEERMQSFGADNNAYTTQDFTLYTVTAPASALSEVVDIEADRFQHLAYEERAFRTETGAVLGEYNKGAANPAQKMWEVLSELAFKQHTYGHTTIGYLADVQAMPDKFAYSRAFFRRFYTPDNTTIVVAGDVAHEQLEALVNKHYQSWTGKRDQPKIPEEPPPTASVRKDLDWDGMSAPQMLIGFRA
ncbi:MAG: Peptidase, partial [Myxococcaceae bacterium]|nr:Peptidase [Myxococcaceae bacterium]